MIVTLMKSDKLISVTLPEKVKGRFELCDQNGNEKFLIIDAVSGKWIIKGYRSVTLEETDGSFVKETVLRENVLYRVLVKGSSEEMCLLAEPLTKGSLTFTKYLINPNSCISIGRSVDNTIFYKNESVSVCHALLYYRGNQWEIVDQGSTNGVFVNTYRVSSMALRPGDVINIVGLKIIVGQGFLMLNNPGEQINISRDELFLFNRQDISEEMQEDSSEEEIISENYFYRSPRFKRDIQKKEIKIDAPPTAQNAEEIPLAIMLGPSLTMGMVSLATAGITIGNIINNTASLANSITSLLMSVSMMLSCVLWPTLTKRYEKKRRREKEKLRQDKYSAYLQEIRDEITKLSLLQADIIRENNSAVEVYIDRIMERDRKLWERTVGHDDFLSLRLGIGNLELQVDIKYPEKKFTMDDDNLQYALYALAEEPKLVRDVPVSLSLVEDYVSGIIGKRGEVLNFFKNVLLQITTLHSYDEVKLVFIVAENEWFEWEYVKWFPHTWNDEKTMRFIAKNVSEVKELSAYLETILDARASDDKEYTEFNPYYVVIAADKALADKAEIVSQIVKQKTNKGFSLITLFDHIGCLPKECSMVVEVNGDQSAIYDKNDTSGQKIAFRADNFECRQAEKLAIKLANIKLDLSSQRYQLPSMYTFLEMYGVGKIEHLNPLVRWRENNPTNSLQAPVGVDGTGELFVLDLHEKIHGPHGLVAGMTGSGKSEFIITYILSMAVNYHPNEVAFILIDYKGGGLAGAFEDDEKGIKLPHLAGTITNLDGASINRSLISIQSELRRRQAIFNEARKVSNEGTMDIYKYQRLYREGVVHEAVPHLFIISDEFAELKTQQPDFMQQLISAARIGRSLGVHLILATQKPAGVVDDQIWSNSRFRVCLKVQEKADSMDMIKRPDAANLSNTGRFYLQVGFNEFFDMGQSAWCGAPYYPSEQIEKQKDDTIRIIDDLGKVIKEVKPIDKKTQQKSKENQIVAIVKYLSDLAKEESISVRRLWLDAIPDFIYVDKLVEKYQYKAKSLLLAPVIGEYDDPFNQRQELLTLPLSEEGNAIIYGSAGSGKGIFLRSMIYSLLCNHTPKELNLYLLDFGTEMLRIFAKAPQVGDVLFSNEAEKIANLMKMLKSEIVKRKQLFADYGGDYISYCKKSGDIIPNIVVVINNYAAFAEMYENEEDSIAVLTREGVKYGLTFVFTAASSNAVRYRLQQNFKQMIVLQMNDNTDYSGILGNVNGVYPAKIKGRGIIKLDNVYEFQTAYATKADDESEEIRAFCKTLADNTKERAKKIPILPDVVNAEFVAEEISDLAAVPIGVNKQNLQINYMNFQASVISVISARDADTLQGFSSEFIKVLSQVQEINLSVLDLAGLLGKERVINVSYIEKQEDYKVFVEDIFRDMVKRNNDYKDAGMDLQVLAECNRRVCFITGISQLFAALDDDSKDKLRVLLDKARVFYKIHFILCDDVSEISSVAFEQWYKHQVQGNDGLWVGDGIAEQYQLKVSKVTNEHYIDIGNSFGYVLTKGKTSLIKVLGLQQDKEV